MIVVDHPCIYLSGKTSTLGKKDFDKSNNWRIEAKDLLKQLCPCSQCFNPNNVLDLIDTLDAPITEKQTMDIVLYYLFKSTHVIVNLDDSDLETMAELAIAYKCNLPVIGIANNPEKLHPWQRNMCSAIKRDVTEACTYLNEYYLELLYN